MKKDGVYGKDRDPDVHLLYEWKMHPDTQQMYSHYSVLMPMEPEVAGAPNTLWLKPQAVFQPVQSSENAYAHDLAEVSAITEGQDRESEAREAAAMSQEDVNCLTMITESDCKKTAGDCQEPLVVHQDATSSARDEQASTAKDEKTSTVVDETLERESEAREAAAMSQEDVNCLTVISESDCKKAAGDCQEPLVVQQDATSSAKDEKANSDQPEPCAASVSADVDCSAPKPCPAVIEGSVAQTNETLERENEACEVTAPACGTPAVAVPGGCDQLADGSTVKNEDGNLEDLLDREMERENMLEKRSAMKRKQLISTYTAAPECEPPAAKQKLSVNSETEQNFIHAASSVAEKVDQSEPQREVTEQQLEAPEPQEHQEIRPDDVDGADGAAEEAMPHADKQDENLTGVKVSPDTMEQILGLSSWLFSWKPSQEAMRDHVCFIEGGQSKAVATARLVSTTTIERFGQLRSSFAFQNASAAQKNAWRTRILAVD